MGMVSSFACAHLGQVMIDCSLTALIISLCLKADGQQTVTVPGAPIPVVTHRNAIRPSRMCGLGVA